MKFQDYKSLGDLLECIHPGVTIADNNGNFVYAGKEFLSSTGTREEQVIGKYVEDEEVARMFNPCVSRMVYEQKKKITTTQKAMNGKETFVTGIPIFDEKKPPKIRWSFIFISRDPALFQPAVFLCWREWPVPVSS